MSATLGTTEAGDATGATNRSVARLVLVLEANRPLAGSAGFDLDGIHTILVGRGRERTAERKDGVLTVRVPDRRMSSQHAELRLQFIRWQLIDRGSRNGSFVDGRRVTVHELQEGELIELGHTAFLLQRDCPPISTQAPEVSSIPGLATWHGGLQQALANLIKLAGAPVSFLIQGESGTGKEVLARALHALSNRPGAFVAVNAAAIPETLIESELFGHAKGAFSGAVSKRPGLIRAAHEGTFFLDEIADLPAAAQAVLLRVLQEREVRPVGETRTYPVDIRLVSASHKDLLERVQSEQFRQDLYARIAGVRLVLPPLRQRKVDLGILIAHLLPRVAKDAEQLTFSAGAMQALFQHDWPMNIRELENCLLTAAVLAEDGRIESAHLFPVQPDTGPAEPATEIPVNDVNDVSDVNDVNDVNTGPVTEPPRRPARASRPQILEALRENQGNIAAAARKLGMSRQALYRRMDRLDIPRPVREGE